MTTPPSQEENRIVRVRLNARGSVQGVGFRPYVFRLAGETGVAGWVINTTDGAVIEVEGHAENVEVFIDRLPREAKAPISIRDLTRTNIAPTGHTTFHIRDSEVTGPKTAAVMPDLATCAPCLEDMLNPNNRRHFYPFTNCTHCGPRYSILEQIPYDRPHTTMKQFEMCPVCRAEYEDPADRRFHAQPNACPECGPQLALWDTAGRVLSERHEALMTAVDCVRQGQIVAVKGLGGFHLMVDARNEDAVRELRLRKDREEKPLALMFPRLDMIRSWCRVSDTEQQLLTGPEAPIVLLRKQDKVSEGPAASVAPSNPMLGAMLPYTPLHHLLLRELGFPVVATSGNLSDEPICIDEQEALSRLKGIADVFLVHNRPIARPVDDSIVRVMGGVPAVLRRARGYAPHPFTLDQPILEPILAVGGHLKNTVALAIGRDAFMSQHLGDLDTEPALQAFEDAIHTLRGLYRAEPVLTACDMHPDYASTRYARRTHTRPFPGGEEDMGDGLQEGEEEPAAMVAPGHALSGAATSMHRLVLVQHHHAHVVSCMMEHGLHEPVLGIAWDGTGYGPDGTVWGGEFLQANRNTYERVGHVRSFSLPGGDRAVREPRRSAIGLLYEMFGESAFDMDDLAPVRAFHSESRRVLHRVLEQRVQSPRTTSAGRLFDAVASLLDLRQVSSFEGQAAMEVEFAADRAPVDANRYDIPLVTSAVPSDTGILPVNTRAGRPCHVADWEPMIRRIIEDLRAGRDQAAIARAFHGALAGLIVEVARICFSLADDSSETSPTGTQLSREIVGRAATPDHAPDQGMDKIENGRVCPPPSPHAHPMSGTGEAACPALPGPQSSLLETGNGRAVVLSGGCFQNALLLNETISRLKEAGFEPYCHRHVPPNDGGIALGQIGVAMARHSEIINHKSEM